MRCVPAQHFTVAKARTWRSSVDDDPPYQRAADVWSLGQRQRFIDSLLNGYDVPKIYLHDLRGNHPTKVYTVVDGKQRLHAIWSFLEDGFPLADDFRIEATPPVEIPPSVTEPAGAMRFSGLDPAWQRLLLATPLSVVLIRDADEADIDAMFDRLNDGSPLTPAERRNAVAGPLSALVREVAASPALQTLLRDIPDSRGSHRKVAAAAIALEAARRRGGSPAALDDAALDALVRAGRTASIADIEDLRAGVDAGLRRFAEKFRASSPDDAIAALAAVWSIPDVAPAGRAGPGPA